MSRRKWSSDAEQFWSKVKKHRGDKCWEWTGSRYHHPNTKEPTYGCMSFNGHNQGAHRVSWVLHFGPIPEGVEVCHTCDNPPCTNPAHLFLGTHQQNAQDMVSKGRHKYIAHSGEEHGRAKLTDEDVRIILACLRNGVSPTHLSEQYHVTRGVIQCIKENRTWRHIPRDAQTLF